MTYVEKMKAEIDKQTEKEYEFSPVRGCAQQLIDIVGDNEKMAQLVCTDFENGRTVKDCELEIQKKVDEICEEYRKKHPNEKEYKIGISSLFTEKIIRELFGLGAAENKPQAEAAPKVQPLTAFLDEV